MTRIQEILRKAFQIEVDGYTFYSMAADKAAKPAVQELFDKLARDEVEHQAYLKQIMSQVVERGAAAFTLNRRDPQMTSFTSAIFTDEFRRQAAGASFEAGVLSIGMQLESNAIAYFTDAAASATHREVAEFYRSLAEWEQQHLAALNHLYAVIKEDFWTAGGFSPF